MRALRSASALVALAGSVGMAGLVAMAGPSALAGPECAPLVIESGGTYGGCYRSTDPDVPAVMIKTTEEIRLFGARIEHAGEGIDSEVDRVRIRVADSAFTALDPETDEPASQRAIALWRPASVVVEHSRFALGHGIWLGADGDTKTDRLRIMFNESIDVGRFGHPTEPNCCVQFVQLDHIMAAGRIAWNRTANRAGRSSIEDNLNLYGTEGLGVEAPFMIDHNLISGAYPERGRGRGYTGGGIMINDSGGAYVVARANRVVSTTNYGISIAGGHDSHILANRVVNDGRDERGRQVGPEYAVGLAVWDASETGDLTAVDAHGNVVGWLRGGDLTRNDWWTPACDPKPACEDNHSMRGQITATDEQRERRAWWRDLTAAGHTVGPRAD